MRQSAELLTSEPSPFDSHVAEYENWFKENDAAFQSELLVLKKMVPKGEKGIEIGIGSGIFAEKLGIEFGIDPSSRMLELAKRRKLQVKQGFAENLSYQNGSFDFAVFITSICFIHDPVKAIEEACRIIRDRGKIIIAFIDRKSELGKKLAGRKDASLFYRHARFYSVREISSLLKGCGFAILDIYQTLAEPDTKAIEQPLKGFGLGGFVVIKGEKRP